LRVVSLVPSVTETLLHWGVTPVAVTRFCEQPRLTQVGGTKDPDLDAIVALAPDLVVVDTEENRKPDAELLERAGLHLHVTEVRSVADVAPTLAALAARVGVDFDARDIELPASQPERARVFVPIWRRPWMSIGPATYGSSLLEHLGVGNVLAGRGDYPTVELADVAELRPDRVLAPSEPYPFGERHRRELEAVAPVTFVDGQDLFWWGARTPSALARLAALV
jgi:ABC-type Fe3+-hydroxamate transport system substrate-binding protein